MAGRRAVSLSCYERDRKRRKRESGRDRDERAQRHAWVAQDFERLILRREIDPVKMNCEAGGKNGEVKVDAGERGEPERDTEKVQSCHRGNIGCWLRKSHNSRGVGSG